MQLGEVSEINVGVVLTRKTAKYESQNTRKYQLFNLKIYEDRQNNEKIDYEKFISSEDLSRYLAKKGDLLFRLAFPLKVVEVDDDLEGKLISNQYAIIRVNEKKYNYTFMKWFLQSKKMQHQLEKYLVGIAIRTIPVNKIRDIHLPKISLKKQKELVTIFKSWEKQKKLYKQLINEKDQYYNNLIEKIVKENKGE